MFVVRVQKRKKIASKHFRLDVLKSTIKLHMAMLRERVMMVSSEVSPWARSGGLADVLGALPQALAALGYHVAVVVPRYMQAADAPAIRVIDNMAVPLGSAGLASRSGP